MRNTMLTAAAVLAILAVVPGAVRAEEEHRELGAHEHGHGTLNIAVEDKRVSMELEVPGMDIVGFEHAASTGDRKAIVEKATAQLAKPLEVFKVPASAGCSVKDAKVEVKAEHEEGDENHDVHAKEEKGGAHDGDDHDKAERTGEEHDNDEHEGHNEFHVTYALECAKPAELTSISFHYFKMFAGAQNLTVNVVTAKAQSKYEVSRDKPELDLGGMM